MGDALRAEPFPGRKAKALSIGGSVNCAILDDDSLFCDGRGVALPDGCRPKRLYSSDLVALLLCEDANLWHVELETSPFRHEASNVTHAASVATSWCYRQQDGAFWCGNHIHIPSSIPEPRDIAVAQSRPVCAIDAAGAVDCWHDYQEPVHWAPGASIHVPVPLDEPAVTITGGRAHHCALMESGSVVCWSWGEVVNHAVGAPTLNEPRLPPVNLGRYYPR